MAKKKTNKTEKPKIATSIKYQGTVKIYTADSSGNILNKRSGHNEGKFPLFNCIAESLAGRVSNIDKKRPQYLRLFCIGAKGTKPIPTPFYSNQRTVNASIINADPLVDSNTENTEAYVTLKFLIPYSQLLLGEAINLFCLYSADNVNKSEGGLLGATPSAEFILTETDSSGEPVLGSAIDTTISTGNNLNLFVEWTIKVSN